MEETVVMNHKQGEQHHGLEPCGREWGQGGGANQIAFAKKIPKSYLSCEGLCQNIEQVHCPGTAVEGQAQRPHEEEEAPPKKGWYYS